MRLSSLFAIAAAVVTGVQAAPTPEDTSSLTGAGTCRNPVVRKSWHAMSNGERDAYITAVKCLKRKNPKHTDWWAGAQNRYDDFQGLHIWATPNVHFVGHFLPWHRGLLHWYEKALREQCCYQGAQPYWDFTLDTTSERAFVNSPVFDPTHGFGGNGAYIPDVSTFSKAARYRVTLANRTGGGCVQDGPFVGDVNLGPAFNLSYNPHCLRRDFIPKFAMMTGSKDKYNYALSAPDYFQFMRRVEGEGPNFADMRVHSAGHVGVGGEVGEMSNLYSSPGDPLFYMHHAFLDKIWDQWQRQNFAKRSKEITGPDTSMAYPYDFMMGPLPYKNITLEQPLGYGPWGNLTVKDVMDSSNALLCYKYV